MATIGAIAAAFWLSREDPSDEIQTARTGDAYSASPGGDEALVPPGTTPTSRKPASDSGGTPEKSSENPESAFEENQGLSERELRSFFAPGDGADIFRADLLRHQMADGTFLSIAEDHEELFKFIVRQTGLGETALSDLEPSLQNVIDLRLPSILEQADASKELYCDTLDQMAIHRMFVSWDAGSTPPFIDKDDPTGLYNESFGFQANGVKYQASMDSADFPAFDESVRAVADARANLVRELIRAATGDSPTKK